MSARVPLGAPALAFAAGIAAAPLTPPHVAWALLVAAAVWTASLAALGHLRPASVALLLGVAAAGVLRACPLPPAADHVARLPLPLAARVEGRLAAEPARFAPERARLLLDVESVDGEKRSGRARVTVYGPGLPGLAAGQHVAVSARLHRPDSFRNPDGFDHAAALAREGILVVGSARASGVTALEEPRPSWHARVRRSALEVMRGTLPPTSAALLAGLLLGERGGLPPEVDEGFRRAGVYHVLAVSGFNVALVAGAVWALLSLAGAGRRAAALGAIAGVAAFSLVAGPEPSVLRAAVMAGLVLAALLLDREASVLNGLALAALLILAVRPGDLRDPGFQLSFAATAGIVLAPIPRGLLAGAVGVSLAAQLAVLPITLGHFNQLSLVGAVTNLAAVPLAGVATLLGLLAIALSPVARVATEVLLDAVWPVLLALRAVVALAARVPGALVHLPAPHWSAVACYAAALALLLHAWKSRGDTPPRARRAAAAGAVLLALAVGIAAWPLVRPHDGRLRLTVLDVGQGDAIVIETSDGRALLVDAGPGGPGRLDAGERVVAPFLLDRGILRLAAAITTHADTDHAGGMAAVARRVSIASAWSPATLPREPMALGGAALRPLDPGPRPLGPGANEESIVLRLDYGLVSFLLASDATAGLERALAAAAAPLAATVLKVAHHGARGSTTPEFLARVRPAFAVIAVGRRNPYGHPAPETLARLAAAGARILRTDVDGAVVFETDGRALTVVRWASRAVERYCLDPGGIC